MQKKYHLFYCTVLLTSTAIFASDNNALQNTKINTPFNLTSTSTLNTYLALQTRVEFGDLNFGDNYETKNSEFDIYLRRIRFGVYGTAYTKTIRYGLTFSADESIQEELFPAYSEKDGVLLSDAYIQNQISDAIILRFGKSKLPYSRVYLTSSSRQLFAERPYYTYGLREFFRTYVNTNIQLKGRLYNKQFAYYLSLSKAWRSGDLLHTDRGISVEKASPHYVGRVEWSPEGYIETKKSDSHIGKGKHLVFGYYMAIQNDLEYREITNGSENRKLYGADISYHYNNFTFQAEYNAWNINSTERSINQRSEGQYIQLAYLLNDSNFEPAFRHEIYSLDKELPDSRSYTTTLGINKYIINHKLKYSLNWEYTQFEKNFYLLRPINKTSKSAFRFTLQLIL